MALTLDATLQSRMDTVNRRPLVEIISSPAASVIPFKGNYFNTLTALESDPNIISTSTDRLVCTFIQSGKLQYYYTDTNRIAWNLVADLYTSHTVLGSDLCELTNNDIGIVFLINAGSTYELKYIIISQTGTIITSATNIQTGITGWVAHPTIITLANNTYLLVYAQGTGTPPDITKNYYLYKRTSSNFTSWGSATALTLTGFAVTRYKNNPYLLQNANGRIFLHLDYLSFISNNVEVNNLFYTYSDDNGSSWNTPVQITNYDMTTLGTTVLHPIVAEKTNADFTFIYNEVNNVLRLNVNMAGYPESNFSGVHLSYDVGDKKLYVTSHVPYHGTFDAIVDIDVDAWAYIRRYNAGTSPTLPYIPQQSWISEDKYSFSRNAGRMSVIDHDLETVTTYEHNSGLDNWDYNHFGYAGSTGEVKGAFIRVTGSYERMYLVLYNGYFSSQLGIGYIDLTEVADPITGKYTWHEIYYTDTPPHGCGSIYNLQYLEGVNWILITARGGTSGLFAITTTGTPVLNIRNSTHPGFPSTGAKQAVHWNNFVYFTFDYDVTYPSRRGLGRLNLTDESITYFTPTWYSTNDYKLFSIQNMGDGRLLMTSNEFVTGNLLGSACIFDTSNSVWTYFNNSTLPGMLIDRIDYRPTGAQRNIVYDPNTKTIIVGVEDGIIAFSEYGAYSTLKYANVTSVNTTPVYGTVANLSYYDFEHQAVAVYDADNILWIVWQHMDGTEYSLVWNNLIANKDISSYLLKDKPIAIDWEMKKPTKLSFAVSDGQYFDPQYLLSTYSVFFKKGRILSIRMGELISSTAYWQDQGTFIVVESSMSYDSKNYPFLNIKSEDERVLWEENQIVASTNFNDETPKIVTETILLNHADLTVTDYNIPVYDDSHNLFHQFVDMTVMEILEEIFDHFMYFAFIRVDGVFEPRKVDFTGATDHAYTDLTQITKYSPDNKYSSFINRMIVHGMSNNFTEVLYNLEKIQSITGTTGWWGKDIDYEAVYSDDASRACRDPILEIIQSVGDFRIFGIGGGGSECISYIDPDELYCIITTDSPNLVGLVIGLLATVLAIGSYAIGCSLHCGPYIFALSIAVNALCYALGAMASYNYNLWARPIGHERRTYQAQADDNNFILELNGKIIVKEFEDAFCYTISLCQWVAQNNIDIIMAQRNRHKFEKITHLQDEIGDIIEINHPFSGEVLKTFIIKLKREILIGKNCIDKISGWRLLS